MFRTLANAWKIKELRNKILFTCFIVLMYRIGACVTVPFVDVDVFKAQNLFSGGTIFSFMNILSGSAFQQATLFALGVSPYITASIVIQLLGVAFPKLASNDEIGRRRVTQWTRYATIIISIITSIGYYLFLKTNGALVAHENNQFFFAVVIIACYCAGSALVMWLAERINDKGIGNGISIILFANIISRLGSMVYNMVQRIKYTTTIEQGKTKYILAESLFVAGVVILMLALVWFIIFTTDSERRIPVQYAKKVVGRKMYGGQNSNLPIKLNMTGVMPIIFASTIVNIPATIAMFVTPKSGSFWEKVVNAFSTISWFYVVMTFILLLAFAYFYVAISFNPVEVAGNLQKNGGSIPGIRPGKATSDFISRVLSRITLIGALALSVVAVLPHVIQLIINIVVPHTDKLYATSGLWSMSELVFGGSSIIIVVGVILETIREIEAQMTMRHYKGFLD